MTISTETPRQSLGEFFSIKKDTTYAIQQHFFNVVLGLIVFAILSFSIAYIVFS
jgi:hypothetical protein